MLHTITLSSQRIHGHPCLLLHVPFHIQIPPVSGDGNHHSYPWSKPDAAFAKMSAPMRPAWGEPRWPSYAVPLFGPRAAADDATLEQCLQVNFSFTSARWLGTWECTMGATYRADGSPSIAGSSPQPPTNTRDVISGVDVVRQGRTEPFLDISLLCYRGRQRFGEVSH